MEKKLVLHQVKFSPSSIFSKEDVLRIVDSVDENPIKVYKIETVMTEDPAEKLVSLFEYLGRAAGTELGKQVATAATRAHETMDIRIVNTKTYKGKVMLYREIFLDEYFQKKRA
jgi:ABC-type Zn uptake system ZnuABC Zn-binding protein ZnuA